MTSGLLIREFSICSARSEQTRYLRWPCAERKRFALPQLCWRTRSNKRLVENLRPSTENISEIEKENGLYDPNIGFLFIRGLTLEGKIVQAPILLVPVRLAKTSPKRGPIQWQLKQDLDQLITFNKTLLMGLAKYNKVQINEEIYDVEILDDL